MNGSLWMMLALCVLRFARDRRMQRALAMLALTPALASASAADDANERGGWFADGHAMYVHGSRNAADMDRRLADQGYATDTQLSGQTRFGWSVGGGYRFEHLGAELAWTDLGRLDTRITGDTPISTEYLLAIARAQPHSGSGPQASALAFWPLGERLELNARLGMFWWKNALSADARIDDEHDRKRSLDPVLGAGASYRFNRHWTSAVTWQQYRLDGESIGTLGVSVTYRFGSGATASHRAPDRSAHTAAGS